ncbi:MAG TPA: ABC transporter substrate-binding protein, partial [Aequorivita sp.]|nr:ABC transporter substrate-binding protein [Aequorivita sp.]
MQKIVFLFTFLCVFASCKNTETNNKSEEIGRIYRDSVEIKYAKGFEINIFEGYKTITLKNPWPGTARTYKYALVEKDASLPNPESYDAVVEVPLKRIVVTSTTHIPSLEMLNEMETLIGFPSLDYISSEKTRERIAEGKITELGKN